jgi:hypothetical protein
MVTGDLVPEVMRAWVSSVPAVPVGVGVEGAARERTNAQRNHKRGSDPYVPHGLARDAQLGVRPDLVPTAD